jgi:sugar phosphate permease
MMILGNIINKVQLKNFLSLGMVLSSCFFIFISVYFNFAGKFNHVSVIILMSLNGFFQSTGWPGVVGIMGNWFEKGKTGLILGIWAINANIGNIIA